MESFRTHCSWRNNYCKGCLIGTIIVVILMIIAVISVRYGRFNEKSSLHMTPGDTRLISYSSRFCESLTLTNSGLPNNFNTTLATVRTKPKLSVTTNFQISIIDLELSYGLYQFWRFYLYPGSTFELKACILNGASQVMELDVISGKNFDGWLTHPSSLRHIVRKFPITAPCSTGSLPFESEDEYYFAFIGYGDSVGINGTLNFTVPEYYFNSTDTIAQCTTGRENRDPSCNAKVPLESDSYGLISVEDISIGTYASSAAVDVEWTCNPRVWLYAVIAISSVGSVVILIVLCVAAIAASRRCTKINRTRNYTQLNQPNQVQTNGAGGRYGMPPERT